jgi:hypothetical protein
MKDTLSVLYYNRETVARPPARRAAPRRALLVLALGQERHVRELPSQREPDAEHQAQLFKGHPETGTPKAREHAGIKMMLSFICSCRNKIGSFFWFNHCKLY